MLPNVPETLQAIVAQMLHLHPRLPLSPESMPNTLLSPSRTEILWTLRLRH